MSLINIEYSSFFRLVQAASSEMLMWVWTLVDLAIWMSVCPFSKSCFSYESKILYISTLLNLNITLEKCKRRQTLSVRKHKFEPWGGSEGGRVLWRRLLLAAAEICCELQCRTPPHIAAAELTHLRRKAGWGSGPSQHQETGKRRENSHERWWELDKILRSALFMDELNFQRSSCSTIGVHSIIYLLPRVCLRTAALLFFVRSELQI